MQKSINDYWNEYPHKGRIPLTHAQKERFVSELTEHGTLFRFCYAKQAISMFNGFSSILHMPIANYLQTYAPEYGFTYDDTDDCLPYFFWRMIYEQLLQDAISIT